MGIFILIGMIIAFVMLCILAFYYSELKHQPTEEFANSIILLLGSWVTVVMLSIIYRNAYCEVYHYIINKFKNKS